MSQFETVESQRVIRNFEKISAIPRCSGNEKAISDFLVQFAKDLGYEVYQDTVWNVIIKKPASAGYEDIDPVILQGHMDMVCEKNKATEHDFSTDPIRLKVDGNILHAEGTTLGADDGIAVAYCMALLEDKSLCHPPLEILITTQEETGLVGAMKLQGEKLSGKTLINIDGEEEGVFLVSCAGGIRTKLGLPLKKKKSKVDEISLELTITGLRGGHSGADIHKGRGNANKLMGRILFDLKRKVAYNLYALEGGAKMNAIPRECTAIVGIKKKNLEKAKALIQKAEKKIGIEYKKTDPDFKIQLTTVEKLPKNRSLPLKKSIRNTIIHLLLNIPNGVQTMSQDIDGLVESSNNLGVITFDGDQIWFENSTRSSVESKKVEINRKLEELADYTGCLFDNDSDYPGWKYREDSRLREHMRRVYQDLYGKEPVVEAIHAGLECGLFLDVISDELDMIAMGPNMHDVHTPDEHLELDSAARVYDFLTESLKRMKEM
ncbi:MAG: aminoacyl-histidine dipeptidase [Thermotogota bacterium]